MNTNTITITTTALDLLPVGAVVLDENGYSFQKISRHIAPNGAQDTWAIPQPTHPDTHITTPGTDTTMTYQVIHLPPGAEETPLREHEPIVFTDYTPDTAKKLNEHLQGGSVIRDAQGTIYVNKQPHDLVRWKSIDDHRYYAAYDLPFPIRLIHAATAPKEERK